jgi:hypothetical protein
MASAEIGGDSSVEWTVTVDHVRQVPPPEHAPNGNGGWRQHGVDEVDDNQTFTVTIKIPKDRTNANTLASTLNQAAVAAQAQAGNPGSEISFLLPIETTSPGQIVVEWQSSNLLAKHPHPKAVFGRWIRARHAELAEKKPAARKKAKKKVAKKAPKRRAKKARKGTR